MTAHNANPIVPPDRDAGAPHARRHALDDDPPEVREKIIEILRRMPSWRKARLSSQMWKTCRALALAGLRRRYPDLDEEALLRRLPALSLPRELVIKVYGWDPEEVGY